MTSQDLVLIEDGRRHKISRILQAVAITALVILAGLGVRSVFAAPHQVSSPQSGASVEIPETLGVDTVAASEVAQSIARSYLTLDDPQARTHRLEQTWAEAGNAGWDGQGALSLSGNAYTVATNVLDAHRVDVTVAVYANVDAEKGLGGWIGVKVPIQLTNGHASAAGQPRIVGLPTPEPVPDTEKGEVDAELTAGTRQAVEAFFTAYATGDVSAVAAPGATINAPRPLGHIILADWRADKGDGQTRTGIATVTWHIGGAQLTHSYDITLAEVSSAAGSKWQVQEVK